MPNEHHALTLAHEQNELVRLGETVVAPRCQEMHDFANDNAAALLSGFGTAAADITALQTAIAAYAPLITKPREAVVNRKAATGDIAQDEKTADALLKRELDQAMRKFKTKSPPFAGEYASGPMIIDLGSRHEKDNEAQAKAA